jgi:hypothetical protein
MENNDESKPILFKEWFYDGLNEIGEPTKSANILTLSPPLATTGTQIKNVFRSFITKNSKSTETNKLIIKLINALKYLLYKLSDADINIQSTVDDVNTISDPKELAKQKELQIMLLNSFNDKITEQIKIHKQEALKLHTLLLQKKKIKNI